MLILLFAFLAAPTQVEVTATGKVISENFTGVGYHAEMFLDATTPEFFDQVIAKRWKELNPGFARIFHHWTRRQPGVRDQAALDALLKQILFMKHSAGTEVYLTTSSPKDTPEGAEREAYAKAVVDELEYLHKQGATNITTYNMSNELSMGRWAAMVRDLPKFKDYHRLIHAEIARRGLKLALLSTDASPINNWNTIEWAAANMDELTEVYGGHHYANEHPPESLDFYEWFRGKCAEGVKLARSKGKEFILGEFGPAQYLQHKYGVRWDAQRYFGTKLEPLSGLQTAEAALAAMNGGVRAMGYWTFMDYPESDRYFVNHWGLFEWMKNGGAVRAPYYSYGMMSKYFRGPARVFELSASDQRIRAGAVRHSETGKWSVAVINRFESPVQVSVRLPADTGNAVFRKYVYSVGSPPRTEEGDLQEHTGKVNLKAGRFSDEAGPLSLNVYTGYYDDEAPLPVEGLKAERVRYAPNGQQEMNAQKLTWRPSTSADVIYYRILFNGERVGSTVSAEYTDGDVRRPAGGKYTVIAVDSSGNASAARECGVAPQTP
jgi:hypothetical protein